MGVNNRQRRAAKQRKRAHHSRSSARRPQVEEDVRDLIDLAESESEYAVRGLCFVGLPSQREAERAARHLVHGTPTVPLRLLANSVLGIATKQLATVLSGGWHADDVTELVRRRLGTQETDYLAHLLANEPPPATESALACGLRIAAALRFVPLSTPPVSRDPHPQPEVAAQRAGLSAERTKKLATVRGLLAKAERTTFDEEAEALSAKAQELISRYALERLVADDTSGPRTRVIATTRVWLDSPYISAKASVVSAVARANRCRAVFSKLIGVCTVVGDPADLDAVEMLATSLMVQANRAMVRHGEQRDHYGVSRTRSFRQSFLVSFASRIGQRLREANEHTVAESVSQTATEAPGVGLVRLLADQEERVEEAFTVMFPRVSSNQASVSNSAGWVAGKAAADLASLDVHRQVVQGIAGWE